MVEGVAESEAGDAEVERCRAIWAVLNRGGEILEEASVGVEGEIREHACRFR